MNLDQHLGDEFPEPHMGRPPMVETDRGAIVLASVLLALFWGGVALLVRSCAR